MKRHFLTQVSHPFLVIFSYFNTKFTLVKLFIVFISVFLGLAELSAQGNIEFIENKGQWDSRIEYKGTVSNGAFFLRKDGGFTILQHNPTDFANLGRFLHGQNADGSPVTENDKITVRSHSWDVNFVGASTKIKARGEKAIATYNNYFTGDDPSKWAAACKIYQAVTLEDVYPNVDVRYYTNNGYLKYDIIVKPGADISKIALRYEGVDKLQVANKELLIRTSIGDMKESSPYTYQTDLNGKKEVSCKYVVKGNVMRFDVKNYDPTATLVIDPVIVFCSFSGSAADNWGFTATYGPDGSMYGGGIVFSDGFPVSSGAFQTTYQGGSGISPVDIGIIKLSPNGSNRIYATYIGGSGNEQPHSLIVDPQGNLILAGRTNSPITGSGSYPLSNTTTDVIGPNGGYDIVVTKLNATGTAILGSKRIGGTADDGVNISEVRSGTNSLQRNYGDDGRSEVILDGAGNIYVASSTQSVNFPVRGAPFQTVNRGNQDGVVIKLTPDVGAVIFSTYLGGSGNDAAYVLSIGPGGDIYVGGGTESADFIGDHSGTIGPSNNLNASNLPTIDGFIARINNAGTVLIKSTYIGTNAIDQVFGIQFDQLGFPYIMGQTTGNWPIINAVYNNPTGKQFIAKLQPDLSAYIYSTAFGSGSSTPNISPIAFLVDKCQNVYISGWGGNFGNSNAYLSAGTSGLPVTPDAFKSTTDGKDFYFFVLQKDAVAQLFGSFFGETNSATQGGTDHVDGGTSRFDANGVIYQAICGNCKLGLPTGPAYPTTPGAWSTNNISNNCNLTMVKIAMNLAGVAANIRSSIDGVPRDTAGCVPLTVDFTDTIGIAQSYEWDYGDGSPGVTTTTPNSSHTFTSVGTFRVRLIAIDPNTCNVRDTAYINIRVGDLRAILGFNPVKLAPCDSFKYRFDNLSVAPPTRPFGPQSFIWDFGDGSPRIQTGAGPVLHNYANPGTYNVKLILPDTSYCNAPDSIVVPLSVAANVKAGFTTPASGCLPYNAVFKNTSLAGQTWLWDFGDGTTSTAFEPVHLYAVAGTYNVVLIANNPNTCNLSDTTAAFTITVFDSPTPDFSFAPVPPLENTPTTFTNLSSPDAIRFRWDFGDGDTLLTTSRAPIQHQYNATGTFNACLTAYNAIGCDSTICKDVIATIVPLVDVPNAFTPQSGDVNSVVFVRGFGIAKMQFIIWNRWGQKVFETNSVSQGWDGKVKGVVQPMDVYAYTLSIEFSDGTKTTKKGDITLIR